MGLKRMQISPGSSSSLDTGVPLPKSVRVLWAPSPLPVTDQYTQFIQPEQSSPFKILPSSSGTVREPKLLPV